MSEMTNQRRAVLFDLDGVLLDSEGQYSIFWGAMDETFPTGVPDFARYIKGFHLSRILGYFGDDRERRQIMDSLVEFEGQMRYAFFPGALELVGQLRAAGLPMAIVTSSDHKKMASLYSQHPGFPQLFDKIITGDMVTRAKPDPDCFLLGARELGVDIKDCVVLEDSRNGLIAARASGAGVIGIATTLPAAEVEPLCDLMVHDVSQLTVNQLLGL